MNEARNIATENK